jgi:hypothetical protein
LRRHDQSKAKGRANLCQDFPMTATGFPTLTILLPVRNEEMNLP